MILITTILFNFLIIEKAFWEAEAFKEGQSNHIAKVFEMSIYMLIPVACWFERDWKHLALSLITFPFLYFSMFDYILNIIRGVPDPLNYKLFGKPWMKVISLLVVIALFIIYYETI